MKLGFCASLDKASDVKRWGYDYIEPALAPIAAMSDDEFTAAAETFKKAGISCPVCNVMLPGSIRLTGEAAVSAAEQEAYLDKAFARAEKLGIKTVVFGSGGARNVPAGYPFARAVRQVLEFSKLCANVAAKYGLTIVIEPLNSIESNIMNRVSEGIWLTAAVDRENFKVLGDYYHMLVDGEGAMSLVKAGEDLRHVHTATHMGRKYPLQGDEAEQAPLVLALKSIGYSHGLSIEGGARADIEKEAPECCILFRKLIG